MVRYRYALDSEGLVVSAESLVGTRDRDTYASSSGDCSSRTSSQLTL